VFEFGQGSVESEIHSFFQDCLELLEVGVVSEN
jgi:hypothetical protein